MFYSAARRYLLPTCYRQTISILLAAHVAIITQDSIVASQKTDSHELAYASINLITAYLHYLAEERQQLVGVDGQQSEVVSVELQERT